LIRRDANQDLAQALKSVESLSSRVKDTEANWKSLWQSFKSVADLLRTSEDDGRSWAQFILLILVRLEGFIK
jgi:hypothetical protein